ncbi:MAG: hypothetical protein IT364_19770 [Candidatus Hydrogenedentes bacterium]|nr:hypothetical protein [Candidatus Hydrogenedentota bacterium]
MLKRIQDKYRSLSVGLAALGLCIWAAYAALGLLEPWSRNYAPKNVANVFVMIDFTFSLILAPLLSIGLIAFSTYLLVVGLRMERRDVRSLSFCAFGIVLPAAYFGYQAVGLILLATMDF